MPDSEVKVLYPCAVQGGQSSPVVGFDAGGEGDDPGGEVGGDGEEPAGEVLEPVYKQGREGAKGGEVKRSEAQEEQWSV